MCQIYLAAKHRILNIFIKQKIKHGKENVFKSKHDATANWWW